MSVDLAERITQIESRLQELKAIDNPGNYNGGNILFGGANGKATTDGALIWDNTNKRLGIGISLPLANLHIYDNGGSKTFLRVQQHGASGDTLLDLFNDDDTIAGGSNFFKSRSASVTYAQMDGAGFFGVYGPMQIRNAAFSMAAKTGLHVSHQSYYGIRVGASTVGGAVVQNPLTTNTGFDRAFFGHNAIWNDADTLWYIDNIGANDAAGMLIRNGGEIDFVILPTTGASARTVSHATLQAASKLQIATSGAITQILTDTATTTQSTQTNWYHRSTATPAAGFGSQFQWFGDTDTGADRGMVLWRTQWQTVTDASRKAIVLHYVADTLFREYIRGEASGTAAMIGFLGANAVVRQTIGAAAPAGGTGATAGAYDTAAHRDSAITLLNNIRTALINLGLCQN